MRSQNTALREVSLATITGLGFILNLGELPTTTFYEKPFFELFRYQSSMPFVFNTQYTQWKRQAYQLPLQPKANGGSGSKTLAIYLT
jgi:hypothetical protein